MLASPVGITAAAQDESAWEALQAFGTHVAGLVHSPPTAFDIPTVMGGSGPIAAATACLLFTLYVWIGSVLSRNVSYVDRIWSIVPAVYLWIFAAYSGWDARTTVMAVLISVWGLRLTLNFVRRGGYALNSMLLWTEEDYRWPLVRDGFRKALGPWLWLPAWELFNLGFIAIYQMVLLLLIALPGMVTAQAAQLGSAGTTGQLGAWADSLPSALFQPAGVTISAGLPGLASLTPIDWALTAAVAICIAFETVADEQQYSFQTAKYALPEQQRKGELALGFRVTGLFSWSRHPNYFFEQSTWFLLYGFGVVASGRLLNWSLVGAVLLALLFQGSTALTEAITEAKYPRYGDYQACTPAIVPSPPCCRAVIRGGIDKDHQD